MINEKLINPDRLVEETDKLTDYLQGRKLTAGEKLVILEFVADSIKQRTGFQANLLMEVVRREKHANTGR